MIDYSFIFFCPPPGVEPPYWAVPPVGNCTDASAFEILDVDPKDPSYQKQIVAYKKQNPELKLLASVGGWNFPSAYFSALAGSKENRAVFVKSLKAYLDRNSMDGIDIDWEYPCSAPRTNSIKITDTKWKTVHDAGGNCPQDTANLPLLLKDLRAGLGPDATITVATQAAMRNARLMNLPAAEDAVDAFHVMTYDYWVSDTATANLTAPNGNLYNDVTNAANVNMSVSQTIDGYLNELHLPPNKVHVGIALYGHTFYVPDAGDNWNTFGLATQIQSKCFGPLKNTYGGQPAPGTNLCGTIAYSELMAANPDKVYEDPVTKSSIAFFSKGTAGKFCCGAGTWVSYNSASSIAAITAFAQEKKLGGVFIYDSSMDTISKNGQFTYTLMNQIAAACHGGLAPSAPPTPAPTPPPSPTPGPGPSPGPWSGCAGKAAGEYCASSAPDNRAWYYCPQDTKMECGTGTCCKQNGNQISCGWPPC